MITKGEFNLMGMGLQSIIDYMLFKSHSKNMLIMVSNNVQIGVQLTKVCHKNRKIQNKPKTTMQLWTVQLTH